MSIQYGFKVRISEHIIEDNIGQLICTDVILARDGKYEYTSNDVFNDGKFNLIELHRDWEEVRKLKITLEGKPVIHYHANGVDIDITNIGKYKVGHLQNVRESKAEGYNVLIGDLVIDDLETIELIKAGKLREISLGYFYDVDDSDPNRLRQINMIAEHVGLVEQGRAGISKILDAADTYVLAKLRKNGDVSFAEYTDEVNNLRNLNKWIKLKKYGFYRFNPYLDFDQASRITLRTIGMIVDEDKRNAFVVLDEEKRIVRCYYFGKISNEAELLKNDYDLSIFGSNENEIDPYDIPDEIREREETKNEKAPWNDFDILAVGLRLDGLLREADKDFRRYGDNFKGNAWRKFVKLLFDNKVMVENTLNVKLPADKESDDLLLMAENFVRLANKTAKKANDEMFVPLVVTTFDAQSSELHFAGSMEEVQRIVKEAKKQIPALDKEATLDFNQVIDHINTAEGVYVLSVKFDENDDRGKIFVSKAIDADNVEVYCFDNITDLNREFNEYFISFDDAYTTINLKEGRHSKMSALVL